MAIDCHAHVPSLRGTWGLPYFSAQSYVEHMDRLDIGSTIMLPFDGLYHAAGPCNDEVIEWCAPYPDRLIPFGTVTPRDPSAADEVTRCVEELGMPGLKLHPWMQAFHPLEPVMDPIYERARDHDIPLLFHDGTPPLSTPLQVAEVAGRFPGLVVVLGHGGLNDLYGEAIEAARRHSNVWICMASLHVQAMREIVKHAPLERVVFGSDGGLAPEDKQTYIDYRWGMLREIGLGAETYDAIVEHNPRRLLGLDGH